MEETTPDHIPKPGVPEALDPAIGNGALWESDPHSYMLKSVDPRIKLDGFLVDENTHQAIIDKWNGIEPLKLDELPEILQQEDPVLHKEEEVPVKSKSKEKNIPTTKVKESEPIARGKENEEPKPKLEQKPTLADLAGINSPESDPQAKSIGKVGKRVRKVVKKASEEKARDTVADKAVGERAPAGEDLSPFTQWLKGLKGSEYVHPYEDDYGLQQLSASSRGGVSETFADLLASQGYLDQAREMYMKLMEKYPEKSGFFAAKIEALK